MSQFDDSFLAEFLDDYFAECDEHLTAVRRELLELEDAMRQGRVDPSTFEGLLRRFHTIKGLSGMVGLGEAERLAHRVESVLRALHRGETTLTEEGLDALIEGARMVEQVIAARREGGPLPAIGPTMERLAGVVEAAPPSPAPPPGPAASPPTAPSPGPAPSALDEQARRRLEAALREGRHAFLFTFVPSRDLSERGVTVDAVRQRLGEVGEILYTVPRTVEGGGIAFEFLVVTQADPETFAPWAEDGMAWERYEPPPAPPAPEREARRTGVSSVVPPSIVRVDLSRLEELMQVVSELVISRARLEDELVGLRELLPPARYRPLEEVGRSLERQLRDLREGVMRLRMVPVGEAFERMRFVVRDLARESGKRVRLVMEGQETEIDKFVVERMMDPLLHLVRNAVSHGLEPPEERASRGKPPEGRLELRASTAGDVVVIEVADDGRGVDVERVAARARALGLIGADEVLDERSLLDVICAPGFSTREQADRASGRGVGMSVVKETIEELGGSLALETEPGQGTRFTIQLPLTLAIMDALIVSAGGQRFAVPLPAVREVVELRAISRTRIGEDEMFSYRGGVLPLVRLARWFGLLEQADGGIVLVVRRGAKEAGVLVDRVLGQREIVVRALTDPLVRVPGVAGATELGDGRPILILDVGPLVERG